MDIYKLNSSSLLLLFMLILLFSEWRSAHGAAQVHCTPRPCTSPQGVRGRADSCVFVCSVCSQAAAVWDYTPQRSEGGGIIGSHERRDESHTVTHCSCTKLANKHMCLTSGHVDSFFFFFGWFGKYLIEGHYSEPSFFSHFTSYRVCCIKMITLSCIKKINH